MRRRRAELSAVGLFVIAALMFLALLLYAYGRRNPEDVPWAPLDLAQPIGLFTGRKVAGLVGDAPRCARLLRRAGVRFTPLPDRPAGPHCGLEGAVRLGRGGAFDVGFEPADLGTTCAVAAGLALWDWHVVQPAARRHFGQTITAIDHFGSYSCRRMYGRVGGRWSEHSTANALDIAAFHLSDGRRISVAADWRDPGAKGAFLHDVRDGGCRIFATVLSPDYNRAHHDHFHLDEAERGRWGWRACR